MSRWLLFLLCLLHVQSSFAQSQVVNFGAWTQMWPWIWFDGKTLAQSKHLKPSEKMKWQFAVANLERYQKAGYNWNLVVLRQGKDGADDFRRARAIVDMQKKHGIKTVFRLIENPAIYVEPLSHLVADKGALKDYADWVSAIAAEFAGDVDFYLISNEVDHDLGHNLLKYRRIIADYPHYERLLMVAKAAIKNQSSKSQVVDHGVSAYSLGLAVADFIHENQGISAAYSFWKKYNYSREASITGSIRFARMLSKEGSQRRIAMVKATLQSGLADYHQLHWYFSPAVLSTVLDWIELQSGNARRPLFVSELGYRMLRKRGKTWDGRPANVADYELYSQREHASSLIKNIAILLSHGVRNIQYWQVRVHHERDTSAQLYLPSHEIQRFIASKAKFAYSRLIGLLAKPLTLSLCIEKLGLMTCRFGQTGQVVQLMWSSGKSVHLKLPAGLTKLYDYAGTILQVPDDGYLNVGTEPVILLIDITPAVDATVTSGS